MEEKVIKLLESFKKDYESWLEINNRDNSEISKIRLKEIKIKIDLLELILMWR